MLASQDDFVDDTAVNEGDEFFGLNLKMTTIMVRGYNN